MPTPARLRAALVFQQIPLPHQQGELSMPAMTQLGSPDDSKYAVLLKRSLTISLDAVSAAPWPTRSRDFDAPC